MGNDGGIPIHAQGELGQIIRANREAVKDLGELFRQQHIAGADEEQHRDGEAHKLFGEGKLPESKKEKLIIFVLKK